MTIFLARSGKTQATEIQDGIHSFDLSTLCGTATTRTRVEVAFPAAWPERSVAKLLNHRQIGMAICPITAIVT